MKKNIDGIRLFRSLNLITIIAVYFLILVGGIVRSTGSGMGCPDWPKCFGSYIPPTELSQLPNDYKEIYVAQRMKKNIRLASVLEALGFSSLSVEISEGEVVREEHEFNFTKTWIEYINRLIGVVIGILIFLCLVFSTFYIGKSTRVFVLSVVSFLLVGFQGWTGSLVVSTNLLPGLISFHMVLAIALIALLIYLRFYTKKSELKGVVDHKPYKVRRLIRFCMFLFFAQVLLGTQVREAVDLIANRLGEDNRWFWIDNLGLIFYIHRSYSILLLLVHIYLIYRLTKSIADLDISKYLVWALAGLVLLEILTGVVLSYFALPYFIQPVHLLLAIVIFGLQYYLYLIISERSVDLAS